MTNLTYTATPEAVIISAAAAEKGFLARLAGRAGSASLEDLSQEDWVLAQAIADLRAAAEEEGIDNLSIYDQTISLPHALVAALDSRTAETLGLPPVVDLVFETSVAGVLGNPSFRLTHRWMRDGRVASPRRIGAILQTDRGERRLTRPILDAIAIAEDFDGNASLTEHWSALARFRNSLRSEDAADDPKDAPDAAARIEMMGFLDSLRIRSADAFSISVREDGSGGATFDPTPFSRETMVDAGGSFDETDARLEGAELTRFHAEFGRRGAGMAYQLADNSYLVIDRMAAPALEVMAKKQRADAEERTAFITNPGPDLADAYEQVLERDGRLDGEDEAEREALIEMAIGGAFVETQEYLSARVLGVGTWRPPDIGNAALYETTWLPELFTEAQRAAIASKPLHDLQVISENLVSAEAEGKTEIEIGAGVNLPVAPASCAMVKEAIEEAQALKAESELPEQQVSKNDVAAPTGPVVIKTKLNFDDLTYGPELRPRDSGLADEIPTTVTSTLMSHQIDSFHWQIAAWRAGLPGVLNADEPGLGKTLQTLAFLSWLRKAMAAGAPENRLPILIVAPTSLLQNWEKEVDLHLDDTGLGFVERLYGAGVSSRKHHGSRGKDTADGKARLDFGALEEAIREGRGHGRWLLTTYRTLTDYQHSFAKLRFSAAVFDEIQAVKNPATLGAEALRAVPANFRIGLTGTPVENRLTDLWAIMDQLAPGALASLARFRRRFEPPSSEMVEELHMRTFGMRDGKPPLGIRRLKTDVASDLPPKQRLLHPRVMPPLQAERYLEAHAKAASSPRGGALKALQHIRSVSAHPGAEEGETDAAFIAASARLAATLEILAWINSRNERALIFIEHIKLQHRVAEILRRVFGLEVVPIINGKTPAKKRQPIVDKFQRHIRNDEGFDALILAPRAAGTGLTLTAACHVIHLSRWWNPAVEEQCNDRTHRIGQTQPVTVHVPMAIHPEYITSSFDCLLHNLMRQKRQLASAALWPAGDSDGDISEMLENISVAANLRSSQPITDEAGLHDALAGFSLEIDPLGADRYALRSDPRAGPVELRTGSASGWALGRTASARISLGSNDADKDGPPLTVLDGPMIALWPNYALDA